MTKIDKILDVREKITEYRTISDMGKNAPPGGDQARGDVRQQKAPYAPPEPRFTTSASILR